ncbi:MAG: nicotinate (nicotinamide) nucleotide adenylyltransferase [Sandaracinaceae bacterium]|nr:nicotinate (nicotinamide) nucleotide adenylyltransferase [Sandaracinaceae bacterium]
MTDPSRWSRVGIVGGSFDPPHCGHVLLATYALAVAPIDGILVVPAYSHAFGKQMTPFAHRVEMARRAFSVLDPDRVAISEIERELPAPSYTYRTLEALASSMPRARFRLVVGSDIVKDTSRWTNFARVAELAPLFVIGRGGHDAPDAEHAPIDLPALSSTEVRASLLAGLSVSGLVSASVEAYIAEHALYREQA